MGRHPLPLEERVRRRKETKKLCEQMKRSSLKGREENNAACKEYRRRKKLEKLNQLDEAGPSISAQPSVDGQIFPGGSAEEQGPSHQNSPPITSRKRKHSDAGIPPAPVSIASNPSLDLPSRPMKLFRSTPKWETIKANYFKAISDGPIHRCVCCDRLWFKKQLSNLSLSKIQEKVPRDTIPHLFSNGIPGDGQFCSTCKHYILQGKIPNLAASFGFKYPPLPPCLEVLNPTEERLVALRIPFMNIVEKGYGSQYGSKGTVVNVPIKYQKTVGVLPRNPNDTYILEVQLKKRLMYKSSYMRQNTNPRRVFEAARYLQDTPLYQSENVQIDFSWLDNFEKDAFSPGCNKEVDIAQIPLALGSEEPTDASLENTSTDYWDEEETDDSFVSTLAETMLYPTDKLNRIQGLALAPGENVKPMSLIFDQFGDELSFPKIYNGHMRKFTREKPPTYAEIIRSEIRRYDRRGTTPLKILYSFNKDCQAKVLSCINICLRQRAGTVTAENLSNPEFMKDLELEDHAFKFLKPIKNSPEHWKEEKKRVWAQMRQFGLPHLFLTFSAAEHLWYDLIKCLVFLHQGGRNLTEEEFGKMPTKAKMELIRDDPTVCALYFHNKANELFSALKTKNGPLGEFGIKHFYKRVEFQQRGSPHYHILLYLDGAPQYEDENTKEEDVIRYVDSIMTCSRHHQYVDRQTHRHTDTCYKRQKRGEEKKCRFNIPFFPMDQTCLLVPLKAEDERKDNDAYLRVRERLKELEADPLSRDISFETFLNSLEMTREQYRNAIQSGINRVTLVLKRDVCELMINPYNAEILDMTQSNMDIQYILNHYAAAGYLVDYVNKSYAGLSKVMRNCVQSMKDKPNLSLKQALSEYASTFVNTKEVSAQEAVWSLLELPMSHMSEDVIFIPTFRKENRTRMLKCLEDLAQLDGDSKDVFLTSLLEKYASRPPDMELVCLAEFAAWYNVKNGLYVKRKHAKVIRYAKYKEEKNPPEFYREQAMLFSPWRNEEEDITGHNPDALYRRKLNEIKANRKDYIYHDDIDMDEIMDRFREYDDDFEEEDPEKSTRGEDQFPFDPEEIFKSTLQMDIHQAPQKEFAVLKPNNWSEEKYREMYRSLNAKQRDLVQHITYHARYRKKPIRLFVQGSAGTGKSHVISVLVETYRRNFESPNHDPAYPLFLKLAPTGKAASNIGGMTQHSALGLPLHAGSYCNLSSSNLRHYQSQFRNLEMVILDEISMVGQQTLDMDNKRFKEFMNSEDSFGGLNVILIGDLKQLPPVMDTPLYKPQKHQNLNILAPNLFEEFEFYELTEIMRQKDDLKYAILCSDLRERGLSKEQKDFLLSRRCKKEDLPTDAPILHHYNKDVKRSNQERLALIDSPLVMCCASDIVSGVVSEGKRAKMLQSARNLPESKAGGLTHALALKVKARYILIQNIDTADGLCNGVSGILRYIEMYRAKNSDQDSVKRIWIEFEGGQHIGADMRSRSHAYMIEHKINHRWTPINRVSADVGRRAGEACVIRRQFPVVVGESTTIHKAQGATYQKVILGKINPNELPLIYVGATRPTSGDGLFLDENFVLPNDPKPNDPLLNWLNAKRETALEPRFRFLRERNEPRGLQIMYHNVQSLNKHYEDIKSDPCFMNSDIILLSETWTIRGDKFEFPDFYHVHLISNESRRKPSGVSIYVKKYMCTTPPKIEVYPDYETGIHIAAVNIRKTKIGVLYAKPGSTVDDILEKIGDCYPQEAGEKLILAGDFNIQMGSDDGVEMRDILSSIYCMDMRSNPSEYTTRNRTVIDAIFSTDPVITCGVYESSYSYHLPLYARYN